MWDVSSKYTVIHTSFVSYAQVPLSAQAKIWDPMNHQADAAEGFVWRLTDESSNNATSITYYDDPLLLVNLSHPFKMVLEFH